MRVHDKLYIDGEWVPPASGEQADVISPFTEEVIARVPAGGSADIDRAVDAARRAFDDGEWPRMPVTDRLAIVARVAEVYASRVPEMAAVITAEMGSPIAFAELVQAGSPVRIIEAHVALGEQYRWEEYRHGALPHEVIVRREPVGVVGAIVPWNVPQFITVSKLAPALVTGCTVVLKPASLAPLNALLLAEILDEAGVPRGVVNVVPADRGAAEQLVTHPGVDKITFTGSTSVGRRIASLCGERLKHCTLELGGKSAAIVLDDAPLEPTLEGLRFASLMNNGQACVAQSRVLVSRQRHDEFVDAFADMVDNMTIGDPADRATQIGPLVSRQQRESVEGYIALGREEGARVVVGGNGRPEGQERGWFVQPTVFANADNKMRIAQEEIFGPVVTIIPYDDVDDAVRIANDSEYGLAGSVWTSDVPRGVDVARRVRTGTLGINQLRLDFMAPFGGVKASGLGREFGPEGLDHYVELKTIVPPHTLGLG
jgi:betaine-aldehyde dehydrogenase